MAIVIQKPITDLYLTQDEYNRLNDEYRQAHMFYSGTPPTFETWARQQKEHQARGSLPFNVDVSGLPPKKGWP